MSSLWQVPLLFGTGLVAGFVDAVAGGGGLITIPVLLNLGLDPQKALGTNKLQATFGSGSASGIMRRPEPFRSGIAGLDSFSRWRALRWAPWRCSGSTRFC